MAFNWYKGKTPIEKELVAGAGTFAVGTALAYSSGKVVPATGTTSPEFICSSKGGTIAAGASGAVVGQLIEEDMEFVTTLAATGTSLNVGDKVTIHTDGAQVTATTTNGIVEIVEFLGDKSSGSEVVVKFHPTVIVQTASQS